MLYLDKEKIQDRLKTFSKISALLLGVLGMIVIAGWLFDIPLFKSIFPTTISMKFNTAICFIISGIALWLLNIDNLSVVKKIFLFACLIMVTIFSSLNLCEYLFDTNIGIDELFIKDDVPLVQTIYPGRMAPFAALNFLLFSIAFFTIFFKVKNYKIAQSVSLLLFVSSLFSVCEYIYGVQSFQSFLFNTLMAIHTSVGFVILSFGLLTSQGEKGVITFFTNDSIGGIISRRLVPLVIFLLFFFGWLQLKGEKFGWYKSNFGEAVFSLIDITILVAIILWNAKNIMLEDAKRKIAENEKKEADARIKTLLLAIEQSPVTTVITDIKGSIVYVNPKFTETSGYSSEEVMDKNHRILKSGNKSKAEYKEIWNTLLSGKNWSGLFQNKKKNGELYWESTIISPVKNKKDLITHFLAVKEDITEKIIAEEKRNADEKKLKEHAELLTSKNVQLTDFCNIVSHNLRGPIVNISMLVDFIENSRNEEERKEIIEKFKPVLNNLNENFNELVESLQVRNDHELKSEKINVKESLQKILDGMEAEITRYDAKIEIDTNNAPVIYFPPKYLYSILFNLINNSIKYKSPDRKPVIKINTEKLKDEIILSVSDNGLGIDLKKHGKNLFKIRKVFHEHPDAKGFGLFMTKTHVEALDGKIWAESKPGEGTTFFINFKNQNI